MPTKQRQQDDDARFEEKLALMLRDTRVPGVYVFPIGRKSRLAVKRLPERWQVIDSDSALEGIDKSEFLGHYGHWDLARIIVDNTTRGRRREAIGVLKQAIGEQFAR